MKGEKKKEEGEEKGAKRDIEERKVGWTRGGEDTGKEEERGR